MNRKARVGDYVKITKIPKIKGYEEILKVGDMGKVTYCASTTTKYSVHIDGKKNPADIEHPNSRAYGEVYDFWIPNNCCEVVKTKFKVGDTVNINSSVQMYQTGIVQGYTTIDEVTLVLVLVDDVEPSKKREDGCRYFSESSLELFVEQEDLIKQCLFENADALDEYDPLKFFKDVANKYKTSKGDNMREIKNQKAVDLYFDRKKKALGEDYKNSYNEISEQDEHYLFAFSIQEKFDDYIKNNDDLKNEKIKVLLPPTEETKKKFEELRLIYEENVKNLNKESEEILAMLSGCETYEQEMTILRSYGIVGEDNKLVGGTN